MPTPTLDEFCTDIQKAAEADREKLGPEEDWPAAMFLWKPDDQLEIALIDDAFFENRQTKDNLARQLGLMTLEKAVMAAFLHVVWTFETEDADAMDAAVARGRIDAHPERGEALMIEAVSFDGSRFLKAPILRDGEQAPLIKEWEPMPDGLSSPFLEEMLHAIQAKRAIAEDPVALLREARERAEARGQQDIVGLIDFALSEAERNPDLISNMPVRQWLEAQKGGQT